MQTRRHQASAPHLRERPAGSNSEPGPLLLSPSLPAHPLPYPPRLHTLP